MKKHQTKSTIFAVDKLKIKYPVCFLEQIYYENDTFEYIFKPYYNVIELLDDKVFQGIPGLNMDLKKDVYIRENKIPTFIYERTPQENREDLWELLDEVGLEYLDNLEWLIRTKKIYTGDNFIVEAYYEPRTRFSSGAANYGDEFIIDDIKEISTDNYKLLKFLLDVISQGASLRTKELFIDESNRKYMHKLIYTLYENERRKRSRKQEAGINKAKKDKKYVGRKKIDVSLPLLEEIIEKRKRKEITVEEAMKELGIQSKSTFYRHIKEFKEFHNNIMDEDLGRELK